MSSSPELPILSVRAPESDDAVDPMKSYLEGLPEQYFIKYRKLRLELFFRLDEFVRDAKGTEIEVHAQRLHQEFDRTGDMHFLRLFRAIGLKSSPIVLDHVLGERQRMPPVRVATETNTDRLLGDDSDIPAWYSNAIYFNATHELLGSYREFKAVFFHELVHALVGGPTYHRQKLLDEIVTEFLNQKAFGYGVAWVPEAMELVASLYDLDSKMLLDWYCGRDDDAFRQSLRTNLAKSYSPEAADDIEREVWFLRHWMVNAWARSLDRYQFEDIAQRYFEKIGPDYFRGLAARIKGRPIPDSQMPYEMRVDDPLH